MAKSLDKNQYAYLKALQTEDPDREMWIASYALIDKAKEFGADSVATGSIDGAFAVCKELAKRKLVDKEEGRSSKLNNGYSMNDEGAKALAAYEAAQA